MNYFDRRKRLYRNIPKLNGFEWLMWNHFYNRITFSSNTATTSTPNVKKDMFKSISKVTSMIGIMVRPLRATVSVTAKWIIHCECSNAVIRWKSITKLIFRNFGGRVLGEATQRHAHLYAILKALESLPTDSFKKVCICTNDGSMIKAMTRLLPKWAENGYYLNSNPTVRCRNLETLHKLNTFIRVNPFTYRMKYTPADCNIQMMNIATKLAIAGAKK